MSDEYQPNQVVESQPEPEVMPAEPEMPAEPVEPGAEDTKAADPGDAGASSREETTVQMQAEPEPAVDEVPPTDVPPAVKASPEGDAEDVPMVTAAAATAATAVRPEAAIDDGPVVEAAADPPSVVSLSDLETPRRSDEEEGGILSSIIAFLKDRLWIAGLVVLALLIALIFLPPISLAQRLSGGDYAALDASNPSVVHPDGLTVQRSGDLEGRVRVKLDSVPRAEFVSNNVPEALAEAVQAVPEHLVPKSPYFSIDVKSKEPVAGVMSLVIPNEAEPWETLDLYAWDGSAWQWLPTRLDRDGEVLTSAVDALPASVMVMQNEASARRMAVEVESWPEDLAGSAPDEIDVSGILIGTMGGTTGYVDQLPPASAGGSAAVVPIVRNWMPNHEANSALVSDMLQSDADRAAHVTNLRALVQDGGYPGLVVDYRSVEPQHRDRFARFIADLGAAFDDAGLWLAVVVDTPRLVEDGSWETGGYDWAALGAAVDQLRVVMPYAPTAYTPGGEAEQLMTWAVTQVERSKLMPVYSTLSTDGEKPVAYGTVLETLGQVEVRETVTESVTPGTRLHFSLGDAVTVATDPATEATRVAAGETLYWLGTPQWLRARMELPARYQLGGIVVRDLFAEGNLEGMRAVVAADPSAGGGGTPEMPDVIWEVKDPSGSTTQASTAFSQPEFAWTAPTVTGTYRIAATVAGIDKGNFQLLVAEPTPVMTDTLAASEEPEGVEADPEGAEEGEEEAEPGLAASFVADVTVPDNTQFEKGESFTKTWRLRNAGDVDWPEDTVFAYASGAQLGTVDEIEVGVVEAGEEVDLSVEMVAPEEDGSYRSTWELRADGKAISGGAAYVLIRVGEPTAEAPGEGEQPQQPPAAPQPVASGSFELGGHIRDLGIPYKDTMRYAGMNWVKIQVHFGGGASSAINIAHANGFKIQLSAIGGASMVTKPGFEDEFASWVAGLAAAGADAIEVWNEPNIDREWAVGHISPQAYVNLLCKSYNAIKAANPGTAVISAAPSPTGWFGGCGPNGCDDQPWMEGIYNAGAANCMDYIGAHHNAGATSPSARIGHPANPGDPHHSWFFLPQTELYYNIFRGTRQLFYTEMGYASQEGVPTFSDQFAWARGTDNSEQAAWLSEAVRLSINTGMVRCIIVWNIDFVRYGYDPQDGYAIIRPGGGCPACDALHNVLGTR